MKIPPNEDGSEEVKFSLTIPNAGKVKSLISIDHKEVLSRISKRGNVMLRTLR